MICRRIDILVKKLGGKFILHEAVSPGWDLPSEELERYGVRWRHTPITSEWQTMKSVWTDCGGPLIVAREKL